MNKVIIGIIFILFSSSLFAQNPFNVVGIWQAGTDVEYSGYLENYQFFQNNTFIFNVSQLDGLNRVRSIGGKYQIQKDSILFTPEYTIEYQGGVIQRSNITTKNDSWEIQNAELKKIMLLNAEIQFAKIEICPDSERKSKCIAIDNRKYYK
ncbi:MAG: hypothetical protein ABSD71_14460, partial [Bacteroidales bacterium]